MGAPLDGTLEANHARDIARLLDAPPRPRRGSRPCALGDVRSHVPRPPRRRADGRPNRCRAPVARRRGRGLRCSLRAGPPRDACSHRTRRSCPRIAVAVTSAGARSGLGGSSGGRPHQSPHRRAATGMALLPTCLAVAGLALGAHPSRGYLECPRRARPLGRGPKRRASSRTARRSGGGRGRGSGDRRGDRRPRSSLS